MDTLKGAFPPTYGSPPLSLPKTKSVLFITHILSSFVVRLNTSSSATLTIACSVSRSLQYFSAEYISLNRCGAWYGSWTLCIDR